MPIDEAMAFELAEAWFTPFLGAERMTASHPLREAAFATAEAQILDSYEEHALNAGYTAPYDDPVVMRAIAEDVVMILRGVAELVAGSSTEGEEA
jgi:hypothetical protein